MTNFWKKFSLSLIVLVPMALVMLWFLWEIGRFGNWGLESGYYGHYNRVKHVIEKMPDVVITNHWQHHDITLEDFGFYLLVNQTNSVHVNFPENSTQMKERNKSALQFFIEQEIEKARVVPAPSRD